MDMLQETGRKLGRAAVACTCAATLALASGPARAQEPEADGKTTEATEDLNTQAEKHALKAVQHFNNGAYVDAEEEFRRVAYFVPNWRPLHFNLAVLAEAQGKLGTAVAEYKSFLPHASPDERLMAEQRIDELGRRRGKIAGAYKRQIALTSTAMTLGVGGVAGGGVLVWLAFQRGKDADAYEAQAEDVAASVTYDPMNPGPYDAAQAEAQALRDKAAAFEKQKGPFLYGGIYLLIFGLLAVTYSVIPLRNAIKSKRQLEGLALGPTRLKWTGGAGVQLRF